MTNDRRPDGYAYLFTVITPTYNRAHLLSRVFDSLRQQTLPDFEWVVVDDGSTDDTAEVVAHLAAKGRFPIHYHSQTNGGKHTAVNRGVQEAKGFFVAILDDDDRLLPETLERCCDVWYSIPPGQRDRFVGVTGVCVDADGKVIGSLPQDTMDSDAIDLRLKNLKGDKWGVQRTDVLREFPFPTDLGRFVTEALVWNRIANHYRTRYVNQSLILKEYRPDGLTAHSVHTRMGSPRAAAQYYQELVALDRPMPAQLKLSSYANFVRFSTHAGVPWTQQIRAVPSILWWFAGLVPGVVACLDDRRKEKSL
jgi:glycosyltransferase involved in cell wall biosynthesis